MKNLGVAIKRLLYDPIKARIAYDILASFLIILGHKVLFATYPVPQIAPAAIIIFPLIFVILNEIFGVYGRYKTASVLMKLYLLSVSALSAMLITAVLTQFSVLLVLTAIYVAILTTAPRAFFNFGLKVPRGSYVDTLLHDGQPVLVVGGGGYIGSTVVEQLLAKNYKVRVFDKFLYGQAVLGDLRKNPNLELVSGDVSELYSLTLAVSGTQAVIHLAGLVGDPACAADVELTRHLNIVATRMLKESVKAFLVPRFIFASSCSVYGASQNIVDENSALNPVSLYAQTKIDAENEILLDGFDLFHPTILRFATVFGHSRKPRFDLVANLFVGQAYTNGVITVNGGEQWRPFIHVEDVARSIIRVLEAPLEQVSRQIFNVGDDKLNYTIQEVAEIVAKTVPKSKSGKKVMILSRKSADKRNYHVSFQKIHRVLNFEATMTMQDGVKEMLSAFRKKLYRFAYTNRYYTNVEMTQDLIQEFHTEQYQKTHFSTFEIQKILRKRQTQLAKLTAAKQPELHNLGTLR